MNVRELMSEELFCVTPETAIEDAARLMRDKSVGVLTRAERAAPSSSPQQSRVRIGYISPGKGGFASPNAHPPNQSNSRDFVASRGPAWPVLPHSSLSRNEGVPGSSPGVG